MKTFKVTGSKKYPVFVDAKSLRTLLRRLGQVQLVVTISEVKKVRLN